MIDINIHKTLKAGAREFDLDMKLLAGKGSVTVIHGPSGAGKSTCLKMIAGLLQPDKGVIKVDDQVWFDSGTGISLTPQQRRTGLVFQNYALFPHMTVRQQLAFVTGDKDWIGRLIEIGRIADQVELKPGHLSGGQQQRLAILRAMANKPSLLLMDEPFSALDQSTKAGLLADLQVLWKELGTTVIIVSHYPQELAELAQQQLYIGD